MQEVLDADVVLAGDVADGPDERGHCMRRSGEQFEQVGGGHAEQIEREIAHAGLRQEFLQLCEFAAEEYGYSATRHQREVATGYFDTVAKIIAGGNTSTTALSESTEAMPFQ